MGGVAQNTKRRRARDNSREHPTGDCRLAARRGRRDVEGASPSPVSSRESRRHDDAEMALTRARSMTVCGTAWIFLLPAGGTCRFFLRFVSWFTDNSRNNSRKCKKIEIQENEGSRRNRQGSTGSGQAGSRQASTVISVARLSSRIYILKKALWYCVKL